ncbi:hypothetical protein D1013_07970 [Euzebyella marina]|uniref:Uncharacterized protein n=1 Tax=Euzebyella marina TaxID=1761453 RepID=A0A3G2L4Y1_9FLAO|nr:hypothetical protein D1013_07970 [Euzebyella marina]
MITIFQADMPVVLLVHLGRGRFGIIPLDDAQSLFYGFVKIGGAFVEVFEKSPLVRRVVAIEIGYGISFCL